MLKDDFDKMMMGPDIHIESIDILEGFDTMVFTLDDGRRVTINKDLVIDTVKYLLGEE